MPKFFFGRLSLTSGNGCSQLVLSSWEKGNEWGEGSDSNGRGHRSGNPNAYNQGQWYPDPSMGDQMDPAGIYNNIRERTEQVQDLKRQLDEVRRMRAQSRSQGGGRPPNQGAYASEPNRRDSMFGSQSMDSTYRRERTNPYSDSYYKWQPGPPAGSSYSRFATNAYGNGNSMYKRSRKQFPNNNGTAPYGANNVRRTTGPFGGASMGDNASYPGGNGVNIPQQQQGFRRERGPVGRQSQRIGRNYNAGNMYGGGGENMYGGGGTNMYDNIGNMYGGDGRNRYMDKMPPGAANMNRNRRGSSPAGRGSSMVDTSGFGGSESFRSRRKAVSNTRAAMNRAQNGFMDEGPMPGVMQPPMGYPMEDMQMSKYGGQNEQYPRAPRRRQRRNAYSEGMFGPNAGYGPGPYSGADMTPNRNRGYGDNLFYREQGYGRGIFNKDDNRYSDREKIYRTESPYASSWLVDASRGFGGGVNPRMNRSSRRW
eukprot:CAMPEP_0116068568 /NCGR_PEP_ID=MMETSP0322-20121206/11741_1 /TAXON_ID=163516 /ORGANISM="Leptocylindrus danicus var. apora, Strain B651" /LENGTH=479 /DNA_ID=CAMNT_0003555709 /DNA_START=202 /DNA_END=1642 /DNA_ORIENTATION=-